MNHKKTKKKKNIKISYTFLTVFLLFSLVYLCCTAIYNISKFINYGNKLTELETTHNEAKEMYTRLNAEVEGFRSVEAYEEFLRNHLKYAAKDEVMVIIVRGK